METFLYCQIHLEEVTIILFVNKRKLALKSHGSLGYLLKEIRHEQLLKNKCIILCSIRIFCCHFYKSL